MGIEMAKTGNELDFVYFFSLDRIWKKKIKNEIMLCFFLYVKKHKLNLEEYEKE